SWSMLQNDLWHPAKKVAIALESLIRGQYPRDDLYLVGFSNWAREFKPEELVNIGEWDHVQGTNMMHGLQVARKLLARSRGSNKQIIMITDGGPTVWEQNGRWHFDWPPPPEAILQTLREVRRCAREGITINVFMLWDDEYLKHFVNQMATVNRGRAFYTNPDDLAEYVMIDYLNSKQKHVS
ncbi:MAG: VWA domain-containing protein, partial [Ktedonobacterales bacterium]